MNLSDSSVSSLTRIILNGARAIGISPPQLTNITDLQLRAFLQHQGAATPMLDFSTDPLTALAMACFDEDGDDWDGVTFYYRYSPSSATWVRPFIASDGAAPFDSDYQHGPPQDYPPQVNFFNPPYLTSRQRIQRGVLLFSKLSDKDPVTTTGIPFISADRFSSLLRQWESDNSTGSNPTPIPDRYCGAIVIPAKSKPLIRDWLRIHHQLDQDYVYPEPLSADAHREFVSSCSAKSLIRSDRLPPW